MHAPDTPTAPATMPPDATARALDDSAVGRWWQTTAFLEVAGPDAPALLDGLCTQAVERIGEGHAVAGLFLDAKARIIAPAILHRLPGAEWSGPRNPDPVADAPRLLLETLPDLVEPLRAHLARYRLRAQVTIEPLEQVATAAIIGEHAVARSAALDPGDTPLDGTWTTVAEQARPTRAFIGSAAACARLVRELLPSAGIGHADPDAVEADRIERGIAGLHDLLPGRMPAEVGGMDAAVALDAGCYLGQEPVARLHYRGHANRTLRRLGGAEPIVPATGSGDDADGPLELRRQAAPDARAVGRLTTWAHRPDGTVVALAMLRREVGVDEPLVLAGTDALLRPMDDAAE